MFGIKNTHQSWYSPKYKRGKGEKRRKGKGYRDTGQVGWGRGGREIEREKGEREEDR